MRDRVPPWATPLVPVCEALAVLLAPHGEVALHDLAGGIVVGLWNPLSGRVAGEPSLIAELGELGSAGPIGPYTKVLPDGRPVTAVSAVIPDPDGVPCGLLCVNVDRSPLDRIAALATSWLATAMPPPAPLAQQDWREQIGERIHRFCAERGVRPGHFDPSTRRELIARLDAEGLFAVRRAADLVAGALGVSRATVYAQLKEIRR